jgi:hypothetical protein
MDQRLQAKKAATLEETDLNKRAMRYQYLFTSSKETLLSPHGP